MYKKLLLLLLCAVLCGGCMGREQEETVLLTIDGEEVEIQEGLLYLELTRQAFQDTGGEEIWNMSLAGRDAGQTASEKALESLIRTKVLSRQMLNAELSDEDQRSIDRSIVRLMDTLGAEILDELNITEMDLQAYMKDSYLAYQYRKSLNFLPGSLESELDAKVAEAFAQYDSLDQEAYLQRVQMDAIMMYTGEWIDGNWISYPSSQQEEKLDTMEEVRELLLAGASFAQVRSIYSEDEYLLDNPLLQEGVVQADTESTSVFYRGQIQKDLAEKIFRTPAGEYTDIIKTRYGYIIVWIEGFSDTTAADYRSYRQQLEEARGEYQVSLMKVLSEEQFEVEYERLISEVEVVIHEDVWNAAISD